MDKSSLIAQQIAEKINSSTSGVVIGLTGQWGVGKTYLWRNEIKPVLSTEDIIEVSGLGAESPKDIIRKIVNKGLILKGKSAAKGGKEITKALQNSKELLFTGFKVALKGLDSYIGTNILSMNIDLIGLIDDSTIICVDDIERTSSSLSYEETLGALKVLAEEKKCKVLVIFNDQVLDQQRQDVFKKYSEKIFDKRYHIEVDMDKYLSSHKIKLSTEEGTTSLREILRVFVRSGHTNLRTLNRITQTLTDLLNSKKVTLDQSQIDFLTALIIEESSGELKSKDFYSGLNPVSFFFKKENETENKPEYQFYKKYFGAGENYKFYATYYDFIKYGFINWDQLISELSPPSRSETPGLKIVRNIDESTWYFLSEEELKEKKNTLESFLKGSEQATVSQLFKVYVYYRMALEWLGEPHTTGNLEENLLRRMLENPIDEEEKQYGSLQMLHFSEQKSLWDELYNKYQQARAENQTLLSSQKITKIIDDGDISNFWTQLRDTLDLLKFFYNENTLHKIIEKQHTNPEFTVKVIMTLIEEARSKPPEYLGVYPSEARDLIEKALQSALETTKDKRQISRLNDLSAQLDKLLPKKTSPNNQPSGPTSQNDQTTKNKTEE